MKEPFVSALVWFRRDLRHTDHAALFHALKGARRVWCVFLLDEDILAPLSRVDRRVAFIRESLVELDAGLRQLAAEAGAAHPEQCGLIVRRGHASVEIPKLAAQLGVQDVYANHDDDPAALTRDARVRGKLSDIGVMLYTFKDHVIFERHEVLTGHDLPYSVFTPYKKAWLRKLEPFYVQAYPVARYASRLAPIPADLAPPPDQRVPDLADIGFQPPQTMKIAPGMSGARQLLDDFLPRLPRYQEQRDFPGLKGPSYLSPHLRFGTVSIRELVDAAWSRAQTGCPGAATWLSELIWRDFYHQVLHHHPHVVGHAFKREYDGIAWAKGTKARAQFQAWCEGRTGYPLVDAAMRQLNQTGYMHNRLRMVTASFLTKDLGIDWREGEAYFAAQLLDYDLAANNGGWQWAASTGCDAQPYFRIFNPVTQSQRYDPEGRFIRRYVPELAALPGAALHAPWQLGTADLTAAGVVLGRDYPLPIVEHEAARQATLERYGRVAKGASKQAPAVRTARRRPPARRPT